MNPRPNILLLMSDQHNAQCLGVYGNPVVQTPALDGIAAAGVRFTRAFANSPICAPCRVSLATGQYVHTHGHFGNDLFHFPEPNPNTLGAQLRRYGYQTGVIGKSHTIGRWDEEAFEHRRYTDMCDADRRDPTTNHYFRYLLDHGLGHLYEEGNPTPELAHTQDGSGPARLPYEHSIEHWTGEESLRFLADRDRRRPFFAQVTFQRPHAPIAPAPEHWERYNPEEIVLPASAVDFLERGFAGKPEFMRRKLERGGKSPLATRDVARLKRCIASYYCLISAIDDEIGRILLALEQSGDLSNTVVVYLADHGDFAGEHGLFHKNFGLYDSVVRVPLLLAWPGGPRGRVCEGIAETIDVYPSLCELVDVPIPPEVEGRSLLAGATGTSPGKEEALTEWDHFELGHRVHALRTERYRLVYYDHTHGGELYDHVHDPGEIDNLWNAPDYQPVRMALTERLLDRVAQYGTKTSFATDREVRRQTRVTPTILLHLRRRNWKEIESFYDD